MAKASSKIPRRVTSKLALLVRPRRAGATLQTAAWAKTARPIAGYTGAYTTFALSSIELARERSYDRTLLRLTARGARTFTEGGFELANCHAILVDGDGAPIVRRSHESGRQTLLGPVTTWAHELYDEQLAAAAALVYEVETKIDVRRTVLEGDLRTILLDADDRRPWPLVITAQPDDPLLRLAVRTQFNRGDLELWMAGEATGLHDGHRHEFELDLRDVAGAVVATRAMSLSIGPSGLGFNDYSLRLEKSVARAVHSLAIRGRSEVRAIARVGPFTIPA